MIQSSLSWSIWILYQELPAFDHIKYRSILWVELRSRYASWSPGLLRTFDRGNLGQMHFGIVIEVFLRDRPWPHSRDTLTWSPSLFSSSYQLASQRFKARLNRLAHLIFHLENSLEGLILYFFLNRLSCLSLSFLLFFGFSSKWVRWCCDWLLFFLFRRSLLCCGSWVIITCSSCILGSRFIFYSFEYWL